ncbi:ABC transporter ATP-binding protein [Micromonospora polyrhachis]|uniref:Putative ABC transport system ATP-binding protein n=1 Tax=Micromonospora polyrhachis TaxID=1282883 RepID=A0A7W7SR53_9ACTN|nr:ABC transporter ATP-binding protein [Micromonospora polyrhachis]MBB4959438.1 putative ABC transport system ATP-binding protein [Micromonospora polyrhachis]
MTLDLTDVRLTYPDGDRRLVALDDVDLHVPAGELVAVTGPSGSGKSSLLAVAGALITAESGTVTVAGVAVGPLDQAGRDRLRRERIGFVFQQANLLGSLTVLDQLLLVAHINRTPRTTARDRARHLLDRVGLAAKAGRRPHQLSGGERQRVGVGRALMGEPSLLLVDEPTSALDHERGETVVRLLRDITHENRIATVLVTHDLQHLHLTDRAVTMHDGRLSEVRPATASTRPA